MRIGHKTITGDSRYPHRFYSFGGYVRSDMRFIPVKFNHSHRDNAHNSNPFQGNQFSSDESIELAGSEVCTLTEEQLYEIACSRYRQRMTRDRDQAQAVIQAVCSLAGRLMTRLEWSNILCDCLLHGGFLGTKELIDPWKKVRVYLAILDAL